MSAESNSGKVQSAILKRSARKVSKGLRSVKSFYMMVHAVWRTPQRFRLTPRATKLLIDLCCQYNGFNNGDLTTAWAVMKGYGWRSKDLLQRAQRELEERGWITKTRQGVMERGRHSATLWALTFEGIDDCGKDKRDAGVRPDKTPLHLWRSPERDTEPTTSRRVKKNILDRQPGRACPDSRGESTPKAWPFPPLRPDSRGEIWGNPQPLRPGSRAPINKYAMGYDAGLGPAA